MEMNNLELYFRILRRGINKVPAFVRNLSNYRLEDLRLQMLPRYIATETNLYGVKIKVVDASTYLSMRNEIFQQEIYKFDTTSTEPIIIDCGANIGLSAAYFKRRYPTALVIAYEPDPDIFDVLKENVGRLLLENVTLHQKAIWIENGCIDFQIEGGLSGRIPKPDDGDRRMVVPCVRLKDFLEGFPHIDMLKIDIEGAEYEVLMDSQEVIGKCQHIFIEYHSHRDEAQKLHEILLMLNQKGYRYHIHHAFIRSQPFINRSHMLGMDLQLNIFAYKS
jgi:FkbM family methyltransferase